MDFISAFRAGKNNNFQTTPYIIVSKKL